MTDITPELIDTIKDAAFADRQLLPVPDTDGLYYTIGHLGRPIIVDASARNERPNSKMGAYAHTEPESFGRYVARHAVDGTQVFVEPRLGTATAILDGHGTGPGHGRHTATLALQKAAAFLRVIRHATSERPISQEQMADWLDDISTEIDTTPRDGVKALTPDDLIEIIDTLNVNMSAAQKDVRASGHGRTIVFSEDTKITGGKNNVEIPNKITVRTPVFMGIDKVWVFEIRLSVIARPGQPTQFKLSIPRLDDVIEAATAEAMRIVGETIRDSTIEEIAFYAGRPNHGGHIGAVDIA